MMELNSAMPRSCDPNDYIGVALRDIKEGETIEIVIYPDATWHSDAIDFSQEAIKEALASKDFLRVRQA
jgi:hypothetical protein